MRLVKRGTIPEERLVQLICRKCRSEFEAQTKEIQYYCDPRESFFKWTCEVCKEDNFLSELKFK